MPKPSSTKKPLVAYSDRNIGRWKIELQKLNSQGETKKADELQNRIHQAEKFRRYIDYQDKISLPYFYNQVVCAINQFERAYPQNQSIKTRMALCQLKQGLRRASAPDSHFYFRKLVSQVWVVYKKIENEPSSKLLAELLWNLLCIMHHEDESHSHSPFYLPYTEKTFIQFQESAVKKFLEGSCDQYNYYGLWLSELIQQSVQTSKTQDIKCFLVILSAMQLSNKLDYADLLRSLSDKVSGAPQAGKQVIGELLMLLSLCLVVSGFIGATVLTAGALSPIAAFVLAHAFTLLGVGFGLFSLGAGLLFNGRRKGISRAIADVLKYRCAKENITQLSPYNIFMQPLVLPRDEVKAHDSSELKFGGLLQ